MKTVTTSCIMLLLYCVAGCSWMQLYWDHWTGKSFHWRRITVHHWPRLHTNMVCSYTEHYTLTTHTHGFCSTNLFWRYFVLGQIHQQGAIEDHWSSVLQSKCPSCPTNSFVALNGTQGTDSSQGLIRPWCTK